MHRAGNSKQSRPSWEKLDEWVREQARELIQTVLEEEVNELAARLRSGRRIAVGGSPESKDGDGPRLPSKIDTSESALLYTVKQASERLNIGVSKTWMLIQSGQLASIRVGKLRRIPAQCLRGFVERLIAEQAEKWQPVDTLW